MSTADRRVPVRYLRLLLGWLAARGIDTAQLLQMAGLVRARFDKADETLSPDEVNAFVAAGRQLSGRSDLGFELGRLIKLNSHDILGYGMLSCASVHQMMRLVARHYALVTETFTLRYQRRPGGGDAIYSPLIAMPLEMLRFYLETIAVTHQSQVAMLLGGGNADAYDVHLSMPPPAHRARYDALLPVRFHFDERSLPGVVVRMSAEMLDRPLMMSDPQVVQQVTERLEVLQRRPTSDGGWGEYVSMLLREAEGEQPTLERIAQRLRLSARTVDRNLKKEGVQFRDLAQQIRFDRARALLAAPGATVAQVAERLGFSDSSNFSRAFLRYTGQAPSSLLKR